MVQSTWCCRRGWILSLAALAPGRVGIRTAQGIIQGSVEAGQLQVAVEQILPDIGHTDHLAYVFEDFDVRGARSVSPVVRSTNPRPERSAVCTPFHDPTLKLVSRPLERGSPGLARPGNAPGEPGPEARASRRPRRDPQASRQA